MKIFYLENTDLDNPNKFELSLDDKGKKVVEWFIANQLKLDEPRDTSVIIDAKQFTFGYVVGFLTAQTEDADQKRQVAKFVAEIGQSLGLAHKPGWSAR